MTVIWFLFLIIVDLNKTKFLYLNVERDIILLKHPLMFVRKGAKKWVGGDLRVDSY